MTGIEAAREFEDALSGGAMPAPERIERALGAEEPGLRYLAVRLLDVRGDLKRGSELWSRLAADPDPFVRHAFCRRDDSALMRIRPAVESVIEGVEEMRGLSRELVGRMQAFATTAEQNVRQAEVRSEAQRTSLVRSFKEASSASLWKVFLFALLVGSLTAAATALAILKLGFGDG